MWFLYFEEHRSAAIFATAMTVHFHQVAKIATPWRNYLVNCTVLNERHWKHYRVYGTGKLSIFNLRQIDRYTDM